ncbi:MAG: hypothetical protein AABY15_03405 [Nanoarchaeota archaeon]
MSANNQTLIKEYKGKWYVFTDVMAESWDKKNKLFVKEAKAICDTLDEAYDKALELDEKCGEFEQGTEYGVQFNRLCKDDAEVEIKE